VATGRVLFDLPGHLAPVNAVAVSPDGRRLATAVDSEGRDQLAPPAVKLWDAGTGKLLATIDAQVPLGGYFALDFSPDGAFLVIRSALCRNALWDVTTDPPQYRDDLLWLTERDPSGHLYLNSYRLWFAPDGRQWWVGLAEERSFARLDRSGLPRILIRLDRPWHGGQFVFTPDGRTIAVPVFYDVNEADVSPVRRHVLRWKRAVLGKPGHGFLSSVQLFAADSGRLLAALPECDEDNFQVLGFAADGRTLWTTHVVRSGAGDRRVFQQWAVPTGWPPVWLLAVTALVVLLAVVDWRRRVAILKTG
jgi:WD40 repeat protein